MGQLTMEGPRLGQSLECVRGHACHLYISGEGLLAGEKLMVTEDRFRRTPEGPGLRSLTTCNQWGRVTVSKGAGGKIQVL